MAMHGLDEAGKAELEQFLRTRQLKQPVSALLSRVREENELTRQELRASKSLTYQEMVEELLHAVDSDYIDVEELTDFLNDSEMAGRQHVCIFRMPAQRQARTKLKEILLSPKRLARRAVTLSEFVDVPDTVSARVLLNRPKTVITKVLARRTYWDTKVRDESEDLIVYEKRRHRERSALIVKMSAQTGLVQFRIPPLAKLPNENSKSVSGFVREVAEEAFGSAEWIEELDPFPIADAVNGIMANREEFRLWLDAPETRDVALSVQHKGNPTPTMDLRDDPEWAFQEGYARTSFRGFWRVPDAWVHFHANLDTLRTGPNEHRRFTRLFVPRHCSDEELENVLRGIQRHL